MPLQVFPQTIIASVDKRAAYASQHDGSVNVQYVLLELIRVLNSLLSVSIMVIVLFDDNLIQPFVIANFMTEDDSGVVQIIPLGGMDAAHFTLNALRIDPVLVRTVPTQPDITNLNVIQVCFFSGVPARSEERRVGKEWRS